MPLVRYEVRCEHSLANPELYRTTERDDSEALLEGVAMAGLVGLVRQLGDLAEFAAEIFHDLHDDIVKIVSRGQTLKTRVARLEEDLPVVEKALLTKASQFRFAYTARSKWRAPLPMDQNVCGQGELPRFVRNFYDDCRGPPRLFLLDKFDGDGRGACVKRYTDPTFFRLTWATSQLEKAEQAERERQEQFELLAQQQQQKSSVKRGSNNNNVGPVYPRERLSSAHFENLEGFTGDFTPELRSMRLDLVPEGGDLTPDDEPQSPVLPKVDQGPVLAPLKISAKDIKNAKRGRRMPTPTSDDDDEEGVGEYVDALTTVGSDVDSEHSRWSARLLVDSEHDSHHRESFAQRPMAGAVEWERSESVSTVEARDPSVEKEEQLALVNVEQQPVTTPRSRKQWAKDDGSQAATSSIILSFVDNEGGDLASRLRARLLESTGASSSRALVPHQQEEEEMEFRERSSASSNTSSPYTNLSSSSAVGDDDGFTSESVSSSPKGGPSFCTLLSPPESPPCHSPALNSPRAPPITPFLSSSPSVSRSSSIKHDPSGTSKVPQNCLSPQLIKPPSLCRSSLSPQTSDFPDSESSEKIKDILVTDPRRTSENGGLELEPSRSQDQTSTRPRMWVDRSESNVAATLRAIRQAAAVGSDDDTGSECRSECS